MPIPIIAGAALVLQGVGQIASLVGQRRQRKQAERAARESDRLLQLDTSLALEDANLAAAQQIVQAQREQETQSGLAISTLTEQGVGGPIIDTLLREVSQASAGFREGQRTQMDLNRRDAVRNIRSGQQFIQRELAGVPRPNYASALLNFAAAGIEFAGQDTDANTPRGTQ
jgi:hypothetical protein